MSTLTLRGDSISREFPYGIIESDTGERWALTTGRLEWTSDGILWPGMTEPVDRCEHCGRADWREVGPQTFAQAVERGWLVSLETNSTNSTGRNQ